jgi:hypothetical protein
VLCTLLLHARAPRWTAAATPTHAQAGLTYHQYKANISDVSVLSVEADT